jgi:hypothetical protein
MNELSSVETTFSSTQIYRYVQGFFGDKVKNYNFPCNPTKPDLFLFYDSEVSTPIDLLKDNANEDRVDFLEAMLIMAWAVFQTWSESVVSQGESIYCIDNLDRNAAMKRFSDNLDCEEGQDILRKINMAGDKII